jgi:RHS repeat-associated protein
MKARFTSIATALAALLVLSTTPFTRAEQTDESGNLNPNLLNCCTCITLNAEEPALGTNGNYTVNINWEISTDSPCDQVSISGAELTRGPGQVVIVESSGSSGTIRVTITAEEARDHEGAWRLRVTCEPDPVESTTETESASSAESGCEIDFKLPGCESCSASGCDQTGEPDMQNPGDTPNGDSSVSITIPTTQSNGGITSGNLRLISSDFGDFGPDGSFTFTGRAGLVANMPSDFSITRDGGLITEIGTGAALLKVADGPGSDAFTVTHEFPAGTVIRTTTVSYIKQDGILRMDTALTGDPVTRHEQTRTASGEFVIERGRLIAGQLQALRRESVAQTNPTPDIRVRTRTVEERPEPGADWHTVSAIRTTEENQIHGWVKTEEVIDPDMPEHTGAKLTSTWSYYPPGSPAESLGRLMHHSRYDGYQSLHTYALHQSTVTTPYAGDPAGKTTTTEWDPVAKTRTVTVTVTDEANDHILSQTTTEHTDTSTTRTVETGGDPLVTTTHYKPSGVPFGGKPVRTLHPDGTLTTYDYHWDNQTKVLTTTTEQGATTDGEEVSQGTKTLTVTNSRGTTILRQVTAIGHGTGTAVFESMAVTKVDHLGRPETTAWFPATASANGEQATATDPEWITTTAYSCCGIAMETDMYGIPTFHAYDSLQRRIKTNRLGVTTETHHLGLATETHRYPQTVSASLDAVLVGTNATRIAITTRNLAGTETSSFSPDPTSTAPGDLVETKTEIQYQPAAGLSRSTLTTAPDTFTQTTDYLLDGRIAKTTGDLQPDMEYGYAVNATGEIATQSYLDNGTPRETATTQSDRAGRTLQTAKGTIVTDYDYYGSVGGEIPPGSGGKLRATQDSDQVTTLYAYNAKGERTTTALKLNSAATPTPGTDQLTFTETVPALGTSDKPVWRTINQVSYTSGTSVLSPIVSQTDRTPDGLKSWSWQIGQGPTPSDPDETFTQQGAKYTHSKTTLNGNGAWTTVTTHPDNTKTIQTHTGGLLARVEQVSDGNPGTVIASTDYGYEDDTNGIPGRLRTTTDSRTGPTTTAYLSATADYVKSVKDPGNRETTFAYDSRGRRTHVDAPNTPNPAGGEHDNITITHHNPDGTVDEITGDQTYRVKYGYDYAQRRKTMTTYGTETATTTWIYNQATGLLDRKEYEDDNGTDYEYTAAGRLAKRTWQRGVFTEYHYDSAGRQRAIDYSDSTPDVLYHLDAPGRITHETQGPLDINDGVYSIPIPVRSIAHTHDPATLLPESETHHLGGLTRTLVRTHDAYGRPKVVAAGIDSDNNPATLETTDHFTEFFFGNDGRLFGIDAKDLPRLSGKDYGIEYAYTSNSAHLIHTLTRAGSTSNLVTTHTWDPTRDALLVTDNRLDGALNPLSQYTYTVNPLGQRDKVETVGTAFGIAPVWNWRYNPRGELVSARDTSANNRDLGYIYDAIGNRLATGNVYSVQNGVEQVTNPVAYTANALNQYTVAKGVTLPTTPAPAPYDLDGNLRFDGGVNKDNEAREYVWDAENRLIEVLDVSGQSAVSLVTYAYDSRSRRIRRTDVAAGTITWYLYDGWNVVAEYTDDGEEPLALTRTHTWGLDLSGTMQGAGGVGGLLVVRTGGVNYFATYDGNGNVSEYLTSAGVVAAHFEYDPFGNITGFTEQSQGLAASFAYRFSTKPIDDITGWFYYGYRYYDPVTGRWPSRDPIQERGGVNLYGFVGNDGIFYWDLLGLEALKGYMPWSETSTCDCPITATVTKADVYTDQQGDLKLDFRMKYKLPKPDDDNCKCVKVRAIQLVGRFDLRGNVSLPGTGETKKSRTYGGWRIDWSDESGNIPTDVPFLDNNAQFSDGPWTPESEEGSTKDTGLYLRTNRKHEIYTCFIGVKDDGSHKFLGCVHWGAERKGKNKPIVTPNPAKPTWTCEKPSKWNKVIEQWNRVESEHQIPVIE